MHSPEIIHSRTLPSTFQTRSTAYAICPKCPLGRSCPAAVTVSRPTGVDLTSSSAQQPSRL
jgi:hypothetical protein